MSATSLRILAVADVDRPTEEVVRDLVLRLALDEREPTIRADADGVRLVLDGAESFLVSRVEGDRGASRVTWRSATRNPLRRLFAARRLAALLRTPRATD